MDSIYSSLTNLWGGTEKKSDNNLFKVVNELEVIFKNLDKTLSLELPRLVVVGTQSSGKSTVLNRIITMDILPTGKSMVTRTPINIQLVKSNLNKVDFCDYKNGKLEIIKSVSITTPMPTEGQLCNIKNEIEKQTNILAGENKNISTKMMVIKIHSSYVPNLSLIDLPGITMVACTDKGQPPDIKEQIRNMIGEYIKSNKTIIMAVMAARPDLEADLALDLVKEYDNNYKRTIGVLTKVDLMNKNTDVKDYLENNVSKDLLLNYGYYAVKNKGEMDNLCLEEKKYFETHTAYNGIKNVGITNLSNDLNKIMSEHIRVVLPVVLTDLSQIENEVNNVLSELGYSVPTDSKDKYAMLHSLLSTLSKDFSASIDKRGGNLINTGRLIKETFIEFRGNVDTIFPFTKEEYCDNYVIDIIKNSEGNHMSCLIPPIEVLEKCIIDKRSIRLFEKECNRCVLNIIEQLEKLINTLLNRLSRFPKLTVLIKDKFNKIVIENKKITLCKIDEIISMEETYIWTENETFREILNKITVSKTKLEPDIIRTLLNEYFNTVKNTVKNIIPKIIMYHLVSAIKDSLSIVLFNVDIDTILEESSEISVKRIKYENYKKGIDKAKLFLQEF